jgi:hypothetical protein
MCRACRLFTSPAAFLQINATIDVRYIKLWREAKTLQSLQSPSDGVAFAVGGDLFGKIPEERSSNSVKLARVKLARVDPLFFYS